MAEPLLEIGRVVKPHGLQGEVVVDLVTNRLERLAPDSVLVARRSGAGEEVRELVVESARAHQGRHLVHFVGVRSREDAEALRAFVLLSTPIADPEALFVHELIGAEVVDEAGVAHGRVTAIEANPASDLLVIDGVTLCPLRFVIERSPGKIVVAAPEGIF